ncbi:MAG: hypothetical protein WA814_05405 [Candidatus Baltobacteraceae bacterium]
MRRRPRTRSLTQTNTITNGITPSNDNLGVAVAPAQRLYSKKGGGPRTGPAAAQLAVLPPKTTACLSPK